MKEDTFDDELFTYYRDRFEAETSRTQDLFERLNLGVAILTVLARILRENACRTENRSD